MRTNQDSCLSGVGCSNLQSRQRKGDSEGLGSEGIMVKDGSEEFLRWPGPVGVILALI